MSIRQRLLLWLLSAVSLAIAVAGVSVYHRARVEANQLFDYQLKQIALTVQDQVSDESNVMGSLEEEIDYDFVIQVWTEAGVKRYFSHPHKALPPRTDPGYQTVRTDEGEWQVFSMASGGLLIQTAQPLDIRAQLATSLALRTMMPALWLLMGLAVLIWFIVGRGLRPLEQLALAVRERNPELLHPIPEAHLPAELKPLAMALNDLLQRLDRAMKTQRDFVADAAHELRTPLTALQLQAQLAERAGTDAERTLGFSYLREGLKRATQLVQQLLMLARQEAGVTHTLLARIDLSSLVTNVISEHAPLAQAKGIELRVNAEGAYDVRGDANALRIMISNVIDNAVQYTPQMGAIDVVLSRKDGRSTLDISDTGPGIPGEERLRVFDRFYRREGSAGSGSGLGLAIVKRIADTHGVETLLSDRLSGAGLRIRFTFPRIAS
ncbi:MAG: ATP-binding protein [Burkholderiales bacterium]